ncbi:efflux RND transporter periplasmic adaptor subunit [Cetobacterium sp.]|uniref:efflux RND transporter periplasmic adaptor subunit n=1 Tax=Cetobacterium sp. TaxID=2071632 RepID=UPI003EE46C89
MKVSKKIVLPLLFFLGGAVVSYIVLKPKKVEAIKIKKENYTEKILVSGVVSGIENSIISSSLNGTIDKIFFKEGDFVKKGDLIAKFLTADIEASIKQKEAELISAKAELENTETIVVSNLSLLLKNSKIEYENAKSEFEKYSKLYENKYVNVIELNSKRNTLIEKEIKVQNAMNDLFSSKSGPNKKIVLANLKNKEENLKYEKEQEKKYYIFAPYDSYIRERYVDIGETVAPYSELFLISSLESKIIEIELDEKYSEKVKVGDKIIIYSFGNEKTTGVGNIYFVGKSVNEKKGVLQLKGNFENSSEKFIYGSSVNVEISGQKLESSYLVPKDYIVSKNEKKSVWRERKGKAEEVEVETFDVLDGVVLKENSSLSEDEMIFLKPDKNIESGERINYEIRN